MGEGLQIPCILHFNEEAKYLKKLKDIVINILWMHESSN